MNWKTALLAALAAVALPSAGCKSYATQGSAQVVAQDEAGGVEALAGDDPAYRSSTGIHGDRNTLDGRTGVFNASGRRPKAEER